jgi:hypothetical protein
MKDVRHGEGKWISWTGDGYFSDSYSETIYYTDEHVDMSNEIVLRALASTLQRDGIADSLSDGFKLVENAEVVQGFAGVLPDEKDYTVCSESGETEYGDFVLEVGNFTWVEVEI